MRLSPRTSVTLAAAALLVATAVWFAARDGAIERAPRAAPERAAATAPAVAELARADAPVAAPAVRDAVPTPAPAPVPDAAPLEPLVLESLLAPAPSAAPAVVERRVTTAGAVGTSFVLEIDDPDGAARGRNSLTYEGTRQPAFLEIDGRWEDAGGAREVRRMLGAFEYFAWVFEARGLLPGPVRWRVDLGCCGPFGDGLVLEAGRNLVEVELERVGGAVVVEQTFARLAPSPGWHELYGSDGLLAVEPLVVGEPSRRPEPDDDLRLVEFRRCEPWVELLDADGQRLASVELELPDHELVPGIAADLAATTYSRRVHALAAHGAVEARVISGVPRPFRYEVARDDRAGHAFELALVASEPAPPRRARLFLVLPGDDAPEHLDLVLYGASSRYDPPLAVHRRLATMSVDGGRAVDLEVDLATLPLPLRAMLRRDGHRPLFFDFEALLDRPEPVELVFAPGSGGVVVAAYENNPWKYWHHAPARGFDVAWRTAGSSEEPRGVVVLRLDARGAAEWTSDEDVPFERARLDLAPLERNHLRPQGDVVALFADVAPGVVELRVRD